MVKNGILNLVGSVKESIFLCFFNLLWKGGGVLKIALYNENLGELEILLGQLDQCAREYLRFVEITPYVRQEDF